MAFIEAFPYFPATITEIRDESPRVKTFSLQVLTPWPYVAGHHCVIRLTDEQGYVAARDYSLSSAPSSGSIEISAAKEQHGEVSSWLHERMNVGDTLEISKPLGDHFTWDPSNATSLLLIGGGIGIAPLVSMLREHRLAEADTPISVLYSARNDEDFCYRSELLAVRPQETIALHQSRADDTSTRISKDQISPLLDKSQTIFICGPTEFVNTMERILHHELAVEATRIKTERFG